LKEISHHNFVDINILTTFQALAVVILSVAPVVFSVPLPIALDVFSPQSADVLGPTVATGQ